MNNQSFSVAGWNEWLLQGSFFKIRLGNANEEDARDYFGRIHAVTEAQLRQVLFIGLRLSGVTYKEANAWLFENDETPDRSKFPALFDKPYSCRGLTWEKLLVSSSELGELWNLWLDFAKIIRNHVMHGVRSYSDEWLHLAICIDQAMIMALDVAMVPVLGGRLSGRLNSFSPRLLRGTTGVNLIDLTGKKQPKHPRPRVALAVAHERCAAIKLFLAAPISSGINEEKHVSVNGGTGNE